VKRLIAAIALVLAACGASKAATAPPATQAPTITQAPATTEAPTTLPPTTEAPTTTVPPTTTTVDPMETARTAYAGLTSSNFTLNDIYKKYNPLSAKNIRAYCAEIAPIEEQFANSVRDGSWPASVQDAANTLAKTSAAVAGQEYACANAATPTEAVAAFNAIPGAPNQDAASAMRLALGMTLDR
jgi:hypothetical protein